MSTYTPGYELQRRLVELFRADATLSASPGGLLFPAYAPQKDALPGGAVDRRVYGSRANLPEDPAFRESLPFILVETLEEALNPQEQTMELLNGPVVAFIHTVADKQDEELAEQISARCTTLILSTVLSNARIIAAGLVPDGPSRRDHISVFNDAFTVVSRFRSANVGVLV